MNQLYFPPRSLNIPARVILSISQEDGVDKKRITLLRQDFPLPDGYSSVDAMPHGDRVVFKESGSSWPIAEMGCNFEDAEELWGDLLPIIAEAYLLGMDAGQTPTK